MATYTLISSQVLSSSAASVTFSSIPQTYKDLVVRVSVRDDDTSANTALAKLSTNSSSANISITRLYTDGSTVTSSRLGGQSVMYSPGADSSLATANTFGSIEWYIPQYAGSTTKPISVFGAAETNAATFSSGSQALGTYAGFLNSTTAITSVTIAANGPNWVTNSSFYLYGI